MKELLINITRWGLTAFLVTGMLELGLSLTMRQILAPLKNKRLVVQSLVANLILVPLLAFGIVKVLRLETPFANGLLLLGFAPGAPFIPKLVQIANGNLGFAVGLMVMLMVGTVIDLPLMLPRLVSGVEIDAWQIEKSLFLLMLLPLFAGLLIHAKWRSIPSYVASSLGRLANLSAVLVLLSIVILNFKSILKVLGTGAILAGALFFVSSVCLGCLMGGQDRGIRSALGLGTGSRNVAAALIVGAQSFEDPNVNVMIIASTIVGLLVLFFAAITFRRRAQAAIPTPSPAIIHNPG